jgi:hypothetical protein
VVAKAIALQLTLLLAAMVPQAFPTASAQEVEPFLTLNASAGQYDLGDTAKVSGKVGTLVENTDVVIKWIKPDKKSITQYAVPTSDGIYSATLELDRDDVTGGKWKVEADYSTGSTSTSFIVWDPFFEVQMDDSDDEIFEPGEILKIKGEIDARIRDENKITIAVINSDGLYFASGDVKINDKEEFTYSISLEGSKLSYGEWTIDLKYVAGHRTALTFDVVRSPVSVSVEKSGYFPGETATLLGKVNASAVTPGKETVTIMVTSPDNQIFTSVTARLDTDGSYNYGLELLGPLAGTSGSWKVLVKYGDHKASATFVVKEPQSITAKTSKAVFAFGEKIILTGKVAEIGGNDKVGVHFYFANSRSLYKYVEVTVHQNFSYAYELIPDQLLIPSAYQVLVTYNGQEVSTSFSVKEPTINSNPPIIMRTNKPNYTDSERITISGRIPKSLLTVPSISIQVYHNVTGERVHKSDYVPLGINGTFIYQISPGNVTWTQSDYKVVVVYGDETAQAYFAIEPGDSVVSKTYKLEVDDDRFQYIKYNITGGNYIDRISLSNQTKGLVIVMDYSGQDGTLTIELPRKLIDSLDENGADTRYLVSTFYANGSASDAPSLEESTTVDKRTLVVAFDEDTAAIIIIGTQVIPEFGGPAPAILMITAAILLVTGKFAFKRSRQTR